jgi:hypothetical protein
MLFSLVLGQQDIQVHLKPSFLTEQQDIQGLLHLNFVLKQQEIHSCSSTTQLY